LHIGPAMMIDGSVRVAIRFDDGRAEQRCGGPTADGLCPLAGHGDQVGCAGGMIVALRGTVADGLPLRVRRREGPLCPLALLVRHVPAPWD
jgi:hypothetical protein